MKGFISILLAMVIAMVSASAFAEATVMEGEFSVRNGIRIGLTLEEVLEVETSNGNNNEYTLHTDKIFYDCCVPIAGINGSSLSYYFSEENKLIGIGYRFGDRKNNRVSPTDTYNTMKETLVEKYGNPARDDGKVLSDSIISSDLKDSFSMKKISNMLGSRHEIVDVCQWLVQYQDCIVVIDLYIEEQNGDFCSIGYGMFTHEEFSSIVEKELNEAEDSEVQRNNDL